MNIWWASDENQILSNLAKRPFKDRSGRTYVSVEHAYQTWKSGKFDSTTYSKPWKAGSKFRGLPAKKKDGWNLKLMFRLMERSFISNRRSMLALQDTGDEYLTHTQDTGIWGEKFPEFLQEIRAKHRFR